MVRGAARAPWNCRVALLDGEDHGESLSTLVSDIASYLMHADTTRRMTQSLNDTLYTRHKAHRHPRPVALFRWLKLAQLRWARRLHPLPLAREWFTRDGIIAESCGPTTPQQPWLRRRPRARQARAARVAVSKGA